MIQQNLILIRSFILTVGVIILITHIHPNLLIKYLVAENDPTIVNFVQIMIIIIDLKVGHVFIDIKHVWRDDVAEVCQDVNGFVNLLLVDVGLGGYDANVDPLVGGGVYALVRLKEGIFDDSLQNILEPQALGVIFEPLLLLGLFVLIAN